MADTGVAPQRPKGPKERSPSFPFIPLQTAVERLTAFERTFKRHPAPADKTGLAWGMKEKSSQAYQTLAALKAFGFIEYQGSSGERVALISTEGRTYINAQQESLKSEILRRAALKPAAIQKYWREWGGERPPDPVCLDHLVLKGGFTQSAAETFLRVYDETIAYASLSESDKMQSSDGTSDDSRTALCGSEVEVGDLIQWESSGMLQLPKPARVRAIREHEGQQWVFIDGSETGIPLDEVQLEEKGRGAEAHKHPTPPVLPEELHKPHPPGIRREVLTLDEGDVIITFPEELSAESFEDLEGHLELFLRKARRRAGLPAKARHGSQDDRQKGA